MSGPLALVLALAVLSYPGPERLKEVSKSAEQRIGTSPSASPARSTAAWNLSLAAREIDGKSLAAFLARLDAVAGARQPVLRGAKETEVYRLAAPAVVLIVTKEGLGSGVLLDTDGNVLTNAHVVGNFREVGVVFKPAQEGAEIGDADVRMASVRKVDQVADLALIRVENTPSNVRPLSLGKLETLPVGADVHAIGHPDGESWTYTRGIVSQVRRNYQWVAQTGMKHEATVVQTQTPINPGNSGGPLLNDAGEVIGINSFGSEGEGLNFAVSADDVRAFLDRPGDRRAEIVRENDQRSECEPKVLDSEESSEGTDDLIDLDCDGEVEAVATFPRDPKKPAFVSIDSDENGHVDRILVDGDRDRHFETELYDRDEDGEPELVGYIRKGEDEPYLWERISAKTKAPAAGAPGN